MNASIAKAWKAWKAADAAETAENIAWSKKTRYGISPKGVALHHEADRIWNVFVAECFAASINPFDIVDGKITA